MIKTRRLFLKQFLSVFLIANFFNFNFKKKISKKSKGISKKKSSNFIWYLNNSDK